jgi:hypothetical protein
VSVTVKTKEMKAWWSKKEDERSVVCGKQRRSEEEETKGDVRCGEVSRQEWAVHFRQGEVKKPK